MKSALINTLELVKQLGKLRYESIDKCKQQILEHMAHLEEYKNLFGSYLDEYYLLKTTMRPSYSMTPLLYNISNSLDVIEEVDEDAEENNYSINGNNDNDDENSIGSEFSASTSSSSSSLGPADWHLHFTYADVLLGRSLDDLKKRKRSHNSFSNSSDGDDVNENCCLNIVS